jgi:hypothetical protein
LTEGNDQPDRPVVEAALFELAGTGDAVRRSLGDDALWQAA